MKILKKQLTNPETIYCFSLPEMVQWTSLKFALRLSTMNLY